MWLWARGLESGGPWNIDACSARRPARLRAESCAPDPAGSDQRVARQTSSKPTAEETTAQASRPTTATRRRANEPPRPPRRAPSPARRRCRTIRPIPTAPIAVSPATPERPTATSSRRTATSPGLIAMSARTIRARLATDSDRARKPRPRRGESQEALRRPRATPAPWRTVRNAPTTAGNGATAAGTAVKTIGTATPNACADSSALAPTSPRSMTGLTG